MKNGMHCIYKIVGTKINEIKVATTTKKYMENQRISPARNLGFLACKDGCAHMMVYPLILS